MSKKLTHVEYLERIKKIHDENIIPIENIIDTKTKILHRHTICGHEWVASPECILRGQACSLCRYKAISEKNGIGRGFDNTWYIDRLNTVHRDEIISLEEYKGSSVKIMHMHISCGRKWLANPANLLSGKGCQHCSAKKLGRLKAANEETYKLKLRKHHKDEIINIEEYHNAQTKILHKHLVCGHEWHVVPMSLIKGIGCPKCSFGNGEGCYKSREILVDGKTFKIQGFEEKALRYLVQQGVSVDTIVAGSKSDIPCFRYNFLNKYRLYHPDIFINSREIIEVKSKYTLGITHPDITLLDKNRAKAKSIPNKYLYKLFVFGIKNELVVLPSNWPDLTRNEIGILLQGIRR